MASSNYTGHKVRMVKPSRHSPLYDAVLKGDAAIERGDTIPYSRALMEEIKAEAIKRAQQGESVNNPDVIPSDFQP